MAAGFSLSSIVFNLFFLLQNHAYRKELKSLWQKVQKQEKWVVFLLMKDGGVFIEKRKGGLLKGMYGFPMREQAGQSLTEMLNEWGVYALRELKRKKYTHIFTHIKWEMECVVCEVENAPFEWVSAERLDGEISLPTAFKQCVELL